MSTDSRAPAMALHRLRTAWHALRARRGAGSRGSGAVHFRLMYERFREILSCNDATLQLVADIEDRLSGQGPVPLDLLVRRTRKAAMDAFVMVKNLNQISGNTHASLYAALLAISAELEDACPPDRPDEQHPLLLPLEQLRQEAASVAGTKMARLGEIRARTGLTVPDGFVVTTSAFAAFMTANELWERAQHLDDTFDRHGIGAALAAACREVEAWIRSAVVPERVATAMLGAYDGLAQGRDLRLAVRSSGVGEDARASHAGQYYTALDVDRRGLLAAYRAVVASVYSPAAVAYRFERGLAAAEAAMAVGCLGMVQPRSSGIMCSRRPGAPADEDILVSAAPGLAAALASGELGARTWVMGEGAVMPPHDLLSPTELRALRAAARTLEQCFGGPQEIEWALGPEGLCILQSRPMVEGPAGPADLGPPISDETPLLIGGESASAGIGAGPVVVVRCDADLDDFPAGGVLVARHSSPLYSRVLSRCAAVVTDIGSPFGHMASLAREFGVPAVVGSGRATSVLAPGLPVTVDATRREVFAGMLVHASSPRTRATAGADPALQALRRIARLVTPLSLTNPAATEFRPSACRSLHDVTRYVHEKTFEVMFHCGDVASSDVHARVLAAHLPFTVHVFDVGGGLRHHTRDAEVQRQAELRPQAPSVAAMDAVQVCDVVSEPLRAFLAGLMDDRVRWDRPRPVSARGFLAVVGERMAGLPAGALRVGGASYAIVSDEYLNFSTKAGYHFSTVDAYCGRSLNRNYIHFRFTGGAADESRRLRRIHFVRHVLTALDFRVHTRSDLLVARLDKFERDAVVGRLTALGRLTLCCRQLDMLMDTDPSADHYAQAFLAGEWWRF